MYDQPFSSQAVLLYGPRKSGTSLMHNLLDGGSSILMLPGELKIKESLHKDVTETNLARRYLEAGRLDFPNMHTVEGTSLHVKQGFSFEGLNREQSTALFDFESYARDLSQLLQDDAPTSYRDIVRHDVEAFATAFQKAKGYSHWAAKDVGGNPAHIPAQFTRNFPESKIIYIARDPRFVVRSIILDRKRKNISLTNAQVWFECIKAQKIVDYIFKQAAAGQFVITYEKLTADTETIMKSVAAYLEIEFEPTFCEPTAMGVPVVVRTSSQKTTKVFQQVDTWKRDLTASQILNMTMFFSIRPKFKRRHRNPSYQESVARLS